MKRFTRDDVGQSLVEFSLVLPILVALPFGIIDAGRLVYSYVTVGNAAREGTRIALVTAATDTEVRASIDAHAGLLGRLSTTTTIAPTTTRQSGGSVSVTVEYAYRGITPVGQLFGSLNLTSTSTAAVE